MSLGWRGLKLSTALPTDQRSLACKHYDRHWSSANHVGACSFMKPTMCDATGLW